LKSINLAIQKSADAKIPGENLADWLVSNLCDSPALLIAIDDAHVADGEPQVWKFLSRVVGNRKGGHRWLLTSRTVPDLPLGSWLVDGIANAGIDEFDLRLNIEEARELAVASGVAIREDILASLISMTGGWPMSVAIALRSSVGGELVKRFEDQSRTALYDFAVAELFASLGASEKSMLSLASSMAIVEMRLLVVAGYPQAPVFFKHLADTTAFAEDAGAGAYRLHDLFRARARAVSESNQAEESAQFAKIANSLRLAGRPTKALAMYARCGGGATVEIMSILNDQGVKMVDGGESDLVLSVIGQLPPAVRREIPCVQVLRAMTASLSGGFEEAERLYRKAIGGDDRTMRIVAATRLAHLLGNIGRPGAADVLADYADLPTNEVLTCDALSTFAVALAASNPKRATAVMSRVLLAAQDLDDDEFTVYALHRAGFVAFYAGARENSEHWMLRSSPPQPVSSEWSLGRIACCISSRPRKAATPLLHYGTQVKWPKPPSGPANLRCALRDLPVSSD